MLQADFKAVEEAMRATIRAKEAVVRAQENYRLALEVLEKARRMKSPWPHPI
jgi:hypothetical protein